MESALPAFSRTRTLRLALIPGFLAFGAAFVPWVVPMAVQSALLASLQALAGLLFLLLAGMSFRFNRRKALFQTLVLGVFWLGLVAGDPGRHPWFPIWAEPVVIVMMLVVEVLPERRLASISSAVLLLVLAWLVIGFAFCLKLHLNLPGEAPLPGPRHPLLWPGSGPFLGLAALAMALAAARFFLQNDRTQAVFFWLVAMVVLSVFRAADFLSGPSLQMVPLGLYSLSAFMALHVYSLLETSYHLAYHDQLTGLPGRRALEEALSHAPETVCLAMADVDKFKAFNDKHGHDVGNQVLRLVGATLAAVKHGKAFRYGGEEFVLVFPNSGPEEAAVWAEEFRSNLGRYQFALRHPKRIWPWMGKKNRGAPSLEVVSNETSSKSVIRVTMSIGLAGRRTGEDTAAVLKRADQALYKAKEAGRDRLVQG